MKIRMTLWLMSLRWRLHWLGYEWFVLRPAYARDQGEMSAVFAREANDHYGLTTSNLRGAQDYLEGFVKGAFVRQLPESFLESWWMPIRQEEIDAVADVAASGTR